MNARDFGMTESADELFDSIEIVLARDLKKGDQIAMRGELAALSACLRAFEFAVGEHYFHHGIYIGDSEVIDFGGRDKKSAKPRKVDLLEFMENSCDKKLYRVRYKEGVCLSVNETVQMAEEMVENTSCWPGYDILSNNCETFATYLKTKVKASGQAVRALRAMCSNPQILVLKAASAAVKYTSGSLGSGSSSSR